MRVRRCACENDAGPLRGPANTAHDTRMTTTISRTRLLLAATMLAALASLPSHTAAWGADGHRLIAEVAEGLLSAPAKTEAQRLLALEPGATFASVSTWADEARTPVTAPWHYVNLPRDANCAYSPARSCVQGACVVSAIDHQAAVLASDAPDEARLKALKYLVHFVGDVHQPLHAGYADDRGGNTYQVQFASRGSNLHAVWDSGLIREWPGGIDGLRGAVERDRAAANASPPAQWAEESCRTVEAEGFYPPAHKLDDAYAQRWNPVLARRMAAAARRLAATLNKVLVRLPAGLMEGK